MEATVLAALSAVVVALIAAVGGVIAAVAGRRTQKSVEPISNGWGDEMRRRLVRIELLITDHLADHAGHDLTRRNDLTHND